MRIRLGHLALTAVLTGLLLCVGGCVWAGYVASVYGAPPVPAAYIPARTPMLVVVRDSPDPGGMKIESDTVAREIEQQITMHEIAPLVPAQKVDEFRRTTLSGFSTLSPERIGRAVGADQVLYVQIESSSIDSGTSRDMLKGQITAIVSVIDVKTSQRLWPVDGSEGAGVSYATPMVRIAGETTPLSVSRATYAGLADRTVKLFRKYKPDQE